MTADCGNYSAWGDFFFLQRGPRWHVQERLTLVPSTRRSGNLGWEEADQRGMPPANVYFPTGKCVSEEKHAGNQERLWRHVCETWPERSAGGGGLFLAPSNAISNDNLDADFGSAAAPVAA